MIEVEMDKKTHQNKDTVDLSFSQVEANQLAEFLRYLLNQLLMACMWFEVSSKVTIYQYTYLHIYLCKNL